MKNQHRILVGLVLLLALSSLNFVFLSPIAKGGTIGKKISSPETSTMPLQNSLSNLVFVENDQNGSFSCYTTNFNTKIAQFNRDCVEIEIGQNHSPIRIEFFGGNLFDLDTCDEEPTKLNFIKENKRELKISRGIIYRNIYSGIDLIFNSTIKGLKYYFIVNPGADPSQIELKFQDNVEICLQESRETFNIQENDRIIYQDSNLKTWTEDGNQVECFFEYSDENYITFSLGYYDSNQILVIDPLIYSSVLGGVLDDAVTSIFIDDEGYPYITGNTRSFLYPLTENQTLWRNNPLDNTWDIFITKFEKNISRIIFSTIIGGDGIDNSTDIEVDPDGNVIIVGSTTSTNFPTTFNSVFSEKQGIDEKSDGFFTILNSSGDLYYSTYYGGRYRDAITAVCVTNYKICFSGWTESPDIPITEGVYEPNIVENEDCFVSCFDYLTQRIEFSTYLGGRGTDKTTDMALGPSGNSIIITGLTSSLLFTREEMTIKSHYDVFVAKFDFGVTNLLFLKMFGGVLKNDNSRSIGVDGKGNIYLAGRTFSTDFNISDSAVDFSLSGDSDAFIMKLDGESGGIIYSTYLGGFYDENPMDLTVDTRGYLIVTGLTYSPDFPVAGGAHQRVYVGNGDIFITLFDPNGKITASTYIGTQDQEIPYSIALGDNQTIYLTGSCSKNFPSDPGITYDFGYHIESNEGLDTFIVQYIFDELPPLPKPNYWFQIAIIGLIVLLCGYVYTRYRQYRNFRELKVIEREKNRELPPGGLNLLGLPESPLTVSSVSSNSNLVENGIFKILSKRKRTDIDTLWDIYSQEFDSDKNRFYKILLDLVRRGKIHAMNSNGKKIIYRTKDRLSTFSKSEIGGVLYD